MASAIIVDCCVIFKWKLSSEEHASNALEMYFDWQNGAVEVHGTDLLPSEIGSAFLRALRRGRLTESEALAGTQELLALPFILHATTPLVTRAFAIANQHNQRIYDCFYAALAEREGMEFWTGDERFYNAVASHYAFVRWLANYQRKRS